MKQYRSIRKLMPYENGKDRGAVYIGLTVAFHSRIAGYLEGVEGYEKKVKETIEEICDEVLDVSRLYPEEISIERRDKILWRFSKYMVLLEKGEKDAKKWDKISEGEGAMEV